MRPLRERKLRQFFLRPIVVLSGMGSVHVTLSLEGVALFTDGSDVVVAEVDMIVLSRRQFSSVAPPDFIIFNLYLGRYDT